MEIIHEIIPVQQVLCHRNITKNARCPLCNYTFESVQHLFYYCRFVRPLYSIVFSWISDIAETTITPSLESVIYHNLPGNLDTYQKDTILYILADCKFSIWVSRNLKKYENRKVNSNYIIMFIVNRLKLRIRADYQRFDINNFNNHLVTNCRIRFCQRLILLFSASPNVNVLTVGKQ